MQWRVFGRSAAVARDQVQVGYRHIQLRLIGILQVKELGRTVTQVERDKAEIAANAVLLVHHGIADADLGEVLEHAVDIGRLGPFAPRLAGTARIQLGLGDERNLLLDQHAAHGERRCGNAERCRRCVKRCEVIDLRRQQSVLSKHLGQRLQPSRALGAEQYASARLRGVGQKVC